MDCHIDRGLRLHVESEHKSLYSWAITEVDAKGRPTVRDQIPWVWSLYFTGTSCVLRENLELKSPAEKEPPSRKPSIIDLRRSIQAKLQPGHRGHDGKFWREASFSMFGTGRTIVDFSLTIYALVDPAEEERCDAWGCVSYMSEIDFRNDTTPDCIVFHLYVKQETFDRYAAKIAFRSIDEIVLSVKSVSGFYSDWSPGISTDSVKVLTAGDDQKVALPEGVKFEPPRLGQVGEATLYINRRIEFGKHEEEPSSDIFDVAIAPVAPASSQAQSAVIDGSILRALRSLKRAAWLIAALLMLIFLILASRH